MSEEGWKVIARLRRAQPRNPDTMAVCDAYEAAMVALRRLEEMLIVPRKRKPDGTFDKKAYMRAYMRKRRAKAKAVK